MWNQQQNKSSTRPTITNTNKTFAIIQQKQPASTATTLLSVPAAAADAAAASSSTASSSSSSSPSMQQQQQPPQQPQSQKENDNATNNDFSSNWLTMREARKSISSRFHGTLSSLHSHKDADEQKQPAKEATPTGSKKVSVVTTEAKKVEPESSTTSGTAFDEDEEVDDDVDEDEEEEEGDEDEEVDDAEEPSAKTAQQQHQPVAHQQQPKQQVPTMANDHTVRRLRTFLVTTQHMERAYLTKLKRLVDFRQFLDENFGGSKDDLSVLFASNTIAQIRANHELFVEKLDVCLASLHVLGEQPLVASSDAELRKKKESFVENVIHILTQILQMSFQSYLEFLKSYPKLMTILNKLETTTTTTTKSSNLKTFHECQNEFNRILKATEASNKSAPVITTTTSSNRMLGLGLESDMLLFTSGHNKANDEPFDTTRLFAEEVLRRPLKLFEFIHSLKQECLALVETSPRKNALMSPLLDNDTLKTLREEVFDQINRNIMPKEIRRHEDVVELCRPNNERKLRHLILYGDCLVCCRIKKDKRQLKWFIPIERLEIVDNAAAITSSGKSSKSDAELRHLRDEVAMLRGNLKDSSDAKASSKSQLKIKKKLAEQENELTLQSSRLKLIIRCAPASSTTPAIATAAAVAAISASTNNNCSNGSSSPSSSSPSSHYIAAHHHHHHHASPTHISNNNSSTSNMSSTSTITGVVSSSSLSSSSYQHHQQQPAAAATTNNFSTLASHHSGSSTVSTSSGGGGGGGGAGSSSSGGSGGGGEQFAFLFTSDFERNSWIEEINGAIYAARSRKMSSASVSSSSLSLSGSSSSHHHHLHQSDIESRISSLKKILDTSSHGYANQQQQALKASAQLSSCTGSLELHVKEVCGLQQASRVCIAVELKSCGSYLEVARTKCTEPTTTPVWNEKFNLELQCVDYLRVILYCKTSGNPTPIASQELKIDSSVNFNKIVCAKLNNDLVLHLSMRFLSPKRTITRRRTRNRNDIFGHNLAEVCEREKSKIPRILKDCVEVIESRGIEEVGIYRVSSVVSEVQKIKDLYSKNPNLALIELRQKSAHLAANALKLYLRELPDPLFTSHHYHRFMAAVDLNVTEFRNDELRRIFNELPEINRNIIIFLLNHLNNIASHSAKNMMGLQNLCTLFGPTLMKLSPKEMRQADDMAKEIKESMQQASVLFCLLQMHAQDNLIVEPNKTTTSTSLTVSPNSSAASSTGGGGGSTSSTTSSSSPLYVMTSSSVSSSSSSGGGGGGTVSSTIDSNNNNVTKGAALSSKSGRQGEQCNKMNIQTAL